MCITCKECDMSQRRIKRLHMSSNSISIKVVIDPSLRISMALLHAEEKHINIMQDMSTMPVQM
jgi:hypothetical protein